ncbi:Extracellular basic protease [termite gut metagenome]|uniref:Extracellular basic protease n=1 Tax=termite gut metagenome TaxID=433724 RepID=A0A5J4R4K5_9ZZZZ
MRRNIHFIYYLLSLLLVVSCEEDYPKHEKEENKTPVSQTLPNEEYLEGWIRVKFNRETGDNIQLVTSPSGDTRTGISQVDELMTRLGATKIENVFAEGGEFRERRRKAGLHLWYDVYTGDTQDHAETRTMNLFGDLPFVDIVEFIPVYKQSQSPAEKYINRPYSLAVEAQEIRKTPKEEAETFPFNDPGLSLQWHYQNFGDKPGSQAGADINLFPAWEITGGRSEVIVAVIDGGIDYSHPDLAANMWINTAERNGTAGVDDDKNGYIDDVYGYRWGYNGDLETSVPASGEILPLDHGTHCAGTIAAVNNNGIGVCGVAGGTGKGDGVRIMSCQVFVPDKSSSDPYGNTQSSNGFSDAFVYAADNGAVIASCSWSSPSNSEKDAIDYFIQYAGTDKNGNQTGPMKGGIVICAAGNLNNEDKRYPAAYERCISVCGIRYNYMKAAGSNYGDWITLSAPYGSQSDVEGGIYSTYPMESPNGASQGYGYKTGTSQACPHVSGVAALILSRPRATQSGFTSDEVKEILLSSARNIDSYNPNYVGKLGAGLVDAYNALSSQLEVAITLEVVWNTSSAKLNWSHTNPNEISYYEIFWSQSPLTGIPPENPPAGVEKVRINNTWTSGAKREYQINGLKSNSRYYISVVAVNGLGNRFGKSASGHTLNLPPVWKEKDNQIYFEEFNRITTLDLNNYFYDPDDDAPLSYQAISSDESRMKVTLEDSKLHLSAVSMGLCNVTIIATDSNKAQTTGTLITMARDPKNEADVYPNPVTDKLQIRMGKEVDGEVRVQLFNSAGVKVMDANVMVRPFEPGTIVVGKLSSGVYTLVIKYNGKEIKRNILKY